MESKLSHNRVVGIQIKCLVFMLPEVFRQEMDNLKKFNGNISDVGVWRVGKKSRNWENVKCQFLFSIGCLHIMTIPINVGPFDT